MRAVLQRVTSARVEVEGEVVGAIDRPGLLALVGVTHDDGPDQVERMQESGQPLPGCVLRLQRWFQQEYDPSWLPAARADH